MKKIVLASLLATGLMAAEGEKAPVEKKLVMNSGVDSGMYIGADIGNTKAKGMVSGSVVYPSYPQYNENFSEDIEDDGGSQTFKIGYYLNANNRFMAFYHNINVEEGDGNTYGIGYDYLIGESTFKPFIGVFAGRTNVENDEDGTSISGNTFGAQIGANYAITDNFSIEAGFRYMKSSAEDSISETDTSYSAEATVEIETMTNWFIGVNYKF